MLPWSAAAFGRASPIAALYDEYRYKWKDTVPVFHNHTAVAANVAASAAFVVDSGFDGILLDAEGLSALTPSDTAQLRVDLVSWAASLRAELTRQLPGSMLTWTTDNNATHGNATVYDITRLADHLDLVMPMEYVPCAVLLSRRTPHKQWTPPSPVPEGRCEVGFVHTV